VRGEYDLTMPYVCMEMSGWNTLTLCNLFCANKKEILNAPLPICIIYKFLLNFLFYV
jgi:hypothetical protein